MCGAMGCFTGYWSVVFGKLFAFVRINGYTFSKARLFFLRRENISTHGSQPHDQQKQHHHQLQHPQHQISTQERRKLLKRTRSLAVISEDEYNNRGINNSSSSCETLRLGSSCGSASPYDTASLQHPRRPQLIPRAKLIDRNSLKGRLSKSQQHLSDCYERLNETTTSQRPSQSRSVCGLYSSLPPPLPCLPDPLPYAGRNGRTDRQQQQQQHQDRLNILKWPDDVDGDSSTTNPPRRYRSVQDLNSVSGLVDIVEDHYWPVEENRSVDCIYTQVKRKRKEHRSLDSILFEDDSDELEYFDILNLLPLSNVRLEINESDGTYGNIINTRELLRESKSNPTVISVSTKRKQQHNNGSKNYETCLQHHRRSSRPESTGARITEINENQSEEEGEKLHYRNSSEGITSFPEIARRNSENFVCAYNNGSLEQPKKQENNTKVESFRAKQKTPEKEQLTEFERKKRELFNLYPEEGKQPEKQVSIEETEDTKSLWISDNEDNTTADEMSRRPQVLKVIDNDVTKNVVNKKSPAVDVNKSTSETFKENTICDDTTDYATLRVSNKPDIINDHVHNESTRLSVESARSFFERKNTAEKENRCSVVREGKTILDKAVKGSLGFEARSESSDLGLGSEIGSEVRRLSVDESGDKVKDQSQSNDTKQYEDDKNQKNNCTNLSRSKSCMDSLESQESDEPEFDHVRYKIVKSHLFGKNIFNTTAKKDGNYEGLMQYLREYSFQDLLLDNNVVIIEPVRAEVERKPSFNDSSKLKSSSSFRVSSSANSLNKTTDNIEKSSDKKKNHFIKPRQSSLRKHFFYQPIRVNRELNDEELPDPDTVRNVRRMFEETMKGKFSRDCSSRKSVSMKDLRTLDTTSFECSTEKVEDSSRSRCSSRAKDLTRMFENLQDKTSPTTSLTDHNTDSPVKATESKTRLIAQSFEARSGQSSPSNSQCSKGRVNRYLQRQFHNWDSGSVSSGVSSDYPDTDAGSAPQCTSSEDEDLYCQEDDGVDERYEGHYVPPDVLKKIREHGTSVTYYGGKVVNTCNGPLICPMVCKKTKGSKKSIDYIKFRLVKSNSCDSRLELTGRVINNNQNKHQQGNKAFDLKHFTTIDETPSIEITSIETTDKEIGMEQKETNDTKEQQEQEKRDLPVVIGLEPKKEDQSKNTTTSFKAEFKLGKLEDNSAISRFAPSALTRWQINENTTWKKNTEFGKMEFEEFEVLEDSLNGTSN